MVSAPRRHVCLYPMSSDHEGRSRASTLLQKRDTVSFDVVMLGGAPTRHPWRDIRAIAARLR
jgi:hypothetical protein